MMKALTHNIRQEREDQRDRSAQLFMWCIVVSMHQDDGIGASRLLRACNEMDAFEKKYQTAILYGSSKNATDAMRENLKGICDFEVRLPVDRAPRGRREEQLRMASNQGAEIAWLVMAATCHETFGYGKDRLARLKQNSMNNYKQYLEWEKEDKDLALDRLRRCVQDALKEDLRVTDTDDRKGMLSTPGRGPGVYETAAVYPELPVVPCVDGDVVGGDEYYCWLGSWGESAVQEFVIGRERTYYREDDISEMNDVLCEHYDPELVDNMTEEETRAAYNALPWKKAIFVDVHQYEEEPNAEI